MARVWRALPLALVLVGAFAPPLHACDCVRAGAPCRAFAETPTVFTGRVTRITSVSGGIDTVVHFVVATTFRGAPARTVEVRTGSGGGDCGYPFRVGEEYVVYATRDTASGGLVTSICQRTRSLSEAADDLAYLRAKDDPSRRFGLEGVLNAVERNRDNNTGRAAPLAGVTVTVQGDLGRTTAVTRQDGRFSVWGLAAGRYQVTPALSRRFLPLTQAVTVGGHACEEVHMLATPPARR